MFRLKKQQNAENSQLCSSIIVLTTQKNKISLTARALDSLVRKSLRTMVTIS